MPNKKLKKTELDENENEKKEAVAMDESSTDGSGSSYDDSNDENDEDELEELEGADEEIMIDFEARSPRETDLVSVKTLLGQKLGPFGLDLHEMAKIVVQQENIGNVIFQATAENNNEEEEGEEKEKENNEKNEDEETLLGVLSLIDLKSSQCKSFATSLGAFLHKECEKYDRACKHDSASRITEKLASLLKNKRVAYVINERFINIPCAISVPMYESLLNDLDSLNPTESGGDMALPTNASSSSSSNNDNSNIHFDYWLMLSKIYLESSSSTATAKSSKSIDSNNNNKKSNSSTLIYANPEEEVFEDFSEYMFEIPYGNRVAKSTAGNWSSNDPDLQPSIHALLIPCSKISNILDKVKLLVK